MQPNNIIIVQDVVPLGILPVINARGFSNLVSIGKKNHKKRAVNLILTTLVHQVKLG